MKNSTLVCLHGNSQDSSIFDSFNIPGCMKFAPNLPGHGGRSLEGISNFFEFVDAVYADLKHLDNIVLLGMGMGGHLAYHLIPRLKPLAVFSVGAIPLATRDDLKLAMNPHPFHSYFTRNHITEIQAQELARATLGERHPRLQQLVQMILNTSPEAREIIGTSLSRGEFENEVEILRSYSGKKVLIYPNQDDYINESYLRSLNVIPVKDFRGTRLLTWDCPGQLEQFISLVLFP